MSLIDDVLQRAIPDLEAGTKDQLIKSLEGIGISFIARYIASACAHQVLKGADDVIAAFVKVLPADKGNPVTKGYVEEVDNLFYTFAGDFATYCEAQLAVELAKKEHGNNSQEANDARAKRSPLHDAAVTAFEDAFDFIFHCQTN